MTKYASYTGTDLSNLGSGQLYTVGSDVALDNQLASVLLPGKSGYSPEQLEAAVSNYKASNGGSNSSGKTVGLETINKLFNTTPSTGGTSTIVYAAPSTQIGYNSANGGYASNNTNTGYGTTYYNSYTADDGSDYNKMIEDTYKFVGYDANGIAYGASTKEALDKIMAGGKKYNDDGSITAKNGITYKVKSTGAGYTYVPMNGTVLTGANSSNPVTVYRNNDGSVKNVAYDPAAGTTAKALDVIDIGDNKVIYMDADGQWKEDTQDNYQNYANYYHSVLLPQQQQKQQEEEWWAQQEAMWNAYLQQAQAANQAGVDLSVKEIEAQLENGLAQYGQDAAEAYLQSQIAKQNSALNSAASGNLGGIGTKQYDAAAAQYDAALLQIALEREAFINSCNQQIEQLKAAGRLQDAEILADWAQEKIATYDANYKWLQEFNQTQQQIDYNQMAEDREFYYNRALGLLEKGMLTSDALEVLGVDADTAKVYADYINSVAQYNLDTAKQELANAISSASSTGTGTGTGDGTPTPSPSPSSDQSTDTVTIYSADGTFKEYKVVGGVIQNYKGKPGDYVQDANGSPIYYNPSAKDFNYTQDGYDNYQKEQAQVQKDKDFLAAVKRITGSSYGNATNAVNAVNASVQNYESQISFLKDKQKTVFKSPMEYQYALDAQRRGSATQDQINKLNMYNDYASQINNLSDKEAQLIELLNSYQG